MLILTTYTGIEIMAIKRYSSYEVHYLNDNYEMRKVSFTEKTTKQMDAKNYYSMLTEYGVYLYGVTLSGEKELIEKHETPCVADGSYKTFDWVIERRNSKLFEEITKAITQYQGNTDEVITCEITVGDKKYPIITG